VPISSFEGFDYVALGHLHRRQAAGRVARYPGSPLAYSFAEAGASPEKGFLAIDLGPSGFTEDFVALRPLHRVTRVRGSWAELTRPGAFPERREDYVEAQLTDPQPILDPADSLRLNFPNLLAVRQAAFEIETADASPEAEAARAAQDAARAARGSEDGAGAVLADFRVFHAEIFGTAPEPETEAIFSALLEEAVHAAD
jgi:exonuclease SbcD